MEISASNIEAIKQQQFQTKATFYAGAPRGGPPKGGPPVGGARPGMPSGAPPKGKTPAPVQTKPGNAPPQKGEAPTPTTPATATKKEEPQKPVSNIPAAPPVDHFHCWIRGVPFGTAAAEPAPVMDTLALPKNAADDLANESFHSHASFAASDDEIDFNPPQKEMTLAEQLAAQANKLKPAGGASVVESKPVEKPLSEMTLAEQL